MRARIEGLLKQARIRRQCAITEKNKARYDGKIEAFIRVLEILDEH